MYREVYSGEQSTQRASDNIADFLEELEKKMPSNMVISEFRTDDTMFAMNVAVLDRNTAIGIIETLRTFDTVQDVVVTSIEEREDVLSEEEEAALAAFGFTVIDETGKDEKKAPKDKDEEDADEEEEEAILVIEGTEDEDASALSVKPIGTYYLRIDSETGEPYYVRKYVSFTVGCVYTPADEVVILNNVTGEAESEEED